ncbi:MAG: hypothetical protein AAB656_03135 [Patescibacteria group bacterium]
MKKKLLSLFLPLASVIYFLFPADSYAVCPVCTVAVVAGLGVSRMLGIDDSVTSIWIGGIILSSSFWFSDWLSKKEKFKKFSNIWGVSIAMYLLVLSPLYLSKTIGLPFNIIFGMDKIIFGTIVGSIAFLLGIFIDKKTREINGGKVFFSFQKVVFPISALFISGVIMYAISK